MRCLFGALAVMVVGVGAAQSHAGLETFENVGPDQTVVASTTIDGVTVTFSASGRWPFETRTYDSDFPRSFAGRGDLPNAPLTPPNVSGSRFISTAQHTGVDGAIDEAQPITFSFSSPVKSFGFTTLDLMEDLAQQSSVTSLTAFDVSNALVDQHTLLGSQGPSGLDIDWLVSWSDPVITKAVVTSTIVMGQGRGYGIDDMFLVVPQPSSLTLATIALLGVVGYGWRRRRTDRWRSKC